MDLGWRFARASPSSTSSLAGASVSSRPAIAPAGTRPGDLLRPKSASIFSFALLAPCSTVTGIEARICPTAFCRGPSASLPSTRTAAFRCAGLRIRRSFRVCASRGLRRFPIGNTNGFGRFRDWAGGFDCASDTRQQPGPLVFAGSAGFRHKGSNEFYGRWPSITNKSQGSRVLWLPIFCLKLANSCTCAACLPIGTLNPDAIVRPIPKI